MKDLYRHVGLPPRVDDMDVIRSALARLSETDPRRRDVEHILLNPSRKRTYDRTHRVVEDVGQIRDELGLQDSELARLTGCAEFSADTNSSQETQTEGWFRKSRLHIASILLVLCSVFGMVFIANLMTPSSVDLPTGGTGGDQTLSPEQIQEGMGDEHLASRSGDDRAHDTTHGDETAMDDSRTSPRVADRQDFASPDTDDEDQRVTGNGRADDDESTVRPRPENGYVIKFDYQDGVAPFAIVAPKGSKDYYVKIVDTDTNKDVLAIYVHGGDRAAVDVPLGQYEVRYAVGVGWRGVDDLFGERTRYYRADDTFVFKLEGRYYSGYTVELVKQIGGNLETDPIDEDDF